MSADEWNTVGGDPLMVKCPECGAVVVSDYRYPSLTFRNALHEAWHAALAQRIQQASR